MADDQINRLKQQIVSMEESKQQNKQMAEEHQFELSKMAAKLRLLNHSSPALGQLPKVLKSILNDRTSGVIVTDSAGEVLLLNPAIQRTLGLDLASDVSGDPLQNFYLEDKITSLPSDFLGWGEFQKEGFHKLFYQHPRVPEGMWIQVHCEALVDQTKSQAGVVAIMTDITEQVKTDQDIEKICDSLEQQITIIESAKIELNHLAEKLGKPDWASSAANAEVNENLSSENLGTLLVLDDVAVNRKLLAVQLEKLGYKVDTGATGLDAVRMIRAKEYGLVLMDLDMPEMDGLQATMEIRKYDAATKQHTPIVAMTSYNRDGDRGRCLSSGMDDYLHKGVTKKQLQEVIQRCIRKAKVSPKKTEIMTNLGAETADTIDVQLLQNTYGKSETAEILNLFGGTARTLMNCLKFALEEKEITDVHHFAFSLKGPCATLGANSLVHILMEIVKDVDAANWHWANKRFEILETRYRRIRAKLRAEGI